MSLDKDLPALRQAVEKSPQEPQLRYQYALALQTLEQHAEAEAQYRYLIPFWPQHAMLYNNLGNACLAQGKSQQAFEAYRQALRLDPQLALAHYNLGYWLHLQGDYEAALAHYQEALRLQPEQGHFWNALGSLYQELNLWEAAHQAYQKGLENAPDLASLYNNLGTLYQNQRQEQSALKAYQRALQLAPEFLEAELNLAHLLREQGQMQTAESAYLQLEKRYHYPLGPVYRALSLPPIYAHQTDLDFWEDHFLAGLSQLEQTSFPTALSAQAFQSLPFLLGYHGMAPKVPLERLSRWLRQVLPELNFQAPHIQNLSELPQRRLRIGFLSRFFAEHTIGKLSLGWIKNLNRKAFEVFVFKLGAPHDEMGQRICQAGDQAVILPLHLGQAQKLISQAQLDILFYTDLGMEPLSYLLAHARLAPIQMTSWGHPVTSGINSIDYFLSHTIESPTADQEYSEKLLRLPHLPAYYYPPRFQPQPEKPFGLEGLGRIYLCPQSLFKFHPHFDPILAGILTRDPQAYLVLIDPPYEEWKHLLKVRFKQTVGYPERILFLPRLKESDFLQLLSAADVILDTFPFGGGNTIYQAVALGVPVVTWPGPAFKSRIGAAILKTAGLKETCVSSAEEYIQTALAIAQNPELRQIYAKKLKQNQGEVFENPQSLQALETLLMALASGQQAT